MKTIYNITLVVSIRICTGFEERGGRLKKFKNVDETNRVSATVLGVALGLMRVSRLISFSKIKLKLDGIMSVSCDVTDRLRRPYVNVYYNNMSNIVM
jgi:hypothetical protein